MQVTGVVGRAEALSSIFFLGALITYSRCTSYHGKIRKSVFSCLISIIRSDLSLYIVIVKDSHFVHTLAHVAYASFFTSIIGLKGF